VKSYCSGDDQGACNFLPLENSVTKPKVLRALHTNCKAPINLSVSFDTWSYGWQENTRTYQFHLWWNIVLCVLWIIFTLIKINSSITFGQHHFHNTRSTSRFILPGHLVSTTTLFWHNGGMNCQITFLSFPSNFPTTCMTIYYRVMSSSYSYTL